MIDRYEIGERQTSACAAPTEWLQALGLEASIRQTFRDLVIHTPDEDVPLDAAVDVLDLRLPPSCARCCARRRPTSRSRRRRSTGARGVHACTPTAATCSAPLIVDGSAGGACSPTRRTAIQPPEARLSRGLEVHPHASGDDLELWLDPAYVRAGYSWSFPARDELRVGVGSFEPRDHVKEPTVRLAGDLDVPAVRYQGNWIPHQMRARRRGRRLLRRRQRRALPADDRRGHPHRALLRPGLRARAAHRRRRSPDARAGAARATPTSATSTAGRSRGCCACSAGSGA